MARSTSQIMREIKGIGRKNPLQRVQGDLENKFGLTDLRGRESNLRKTKLETGRLLEQVPENTVAQSRRLGGPVTASATSRLIGRNQEPLTSQMSDLTRTEAGLAQDISGVQDRINRRLGLIQQQRDRRRENLLVELGLAKEAEARSAAATQAAQARRAEIRRQNQLRALLAGDQGQAQIGEGPSQGPAGTSVLKGAERYRDINFMQNNALGRTLAELGGGIRAGLGIQPGMSEMQQRMRQEQGQRNARVNRQEDIVQRFLQANPQFTRDDFGGRVTVGGINKLLQAGVPINPFGGSGLR